MITTYQVRRRMLIGDSWREADELVPEAALWPVTQTLIDVGELVRVEVSEGDFATAVATYAADDSDAIYGLAGVQPFDDTADRPKSTRRSARGKAPVPVTEPEPLDT